MPPSAPDDTMTITLTLNTRTVDAYMDAFRHTDRPRILACLADDVEWVIPGMFHTRGKAAFAEHIVDDGFSGQPDITVTRMLESDDVVVAEGSVRAPRADGGAMHVVFCDVFEMRDGLICRLTSYLMQTPE
jgi:ketosteroid isomerase-like protein